MGELDIMLVHTITAYKIDCGHEGSGPEGVHSPQKTRCAFIPAQQQPSKKFQQALRLVPAFQKQSVPHLVMNSSDARVSWAVGAAAAPPGGALAPAPAPM